MQQIKPVYRHGLLVNADLIIDRIIALGRVPPQLVEQSRAAHARLGLDELRERLAKAEKNEALLKQLQAGNLSTSAAGPEESSSP